MGDRGSLVSGWVWVGLAAHLLLLWIGLGFWIAATLGKKPPREYIDDLGGLL